MIFIGRNPVIYLNIMMYEYNLKGVGKPKHYLGVDREKGKDSELAQYANNNINNLAERIEKLLETKGRSWNTPMAEKYYLKLDGIPSLEGSEISKC